jgi:hypothetical protein
MFPLGKVVTNIRASPQMSKVSDFVKVWFSEHYDSGGYPEQPGEEEYEAKSMAAECIEAAKAAGISEPKLRAELGDVEAYIRTEIEQAVGRVQKND